MDRICLGVLLMGLLLSLGCASCGKSDWGPDGGTAGEGAAAEGASLLPGAEEFSYDNEIGRYAGLTISEAREGDTLYYAFANEAFGAAAYIEYRDKTQGEETVLTLSNGTDSVTATVGRFVHNGPTFLQFTDVTGDGIPEFLYSTHWGGTGAVEATCRVFDFATLEELEICDFVSQLLTCVKVEPIRLFTDEEGCSYCACEVSLAEQKEAADCVVPVKDGATLEWCTFTPANGSKLASIGVSEDGTLAVSVGISLDNSIPGQYLGQVKADLQYRQETGSFELDMDTLALS